MTPALRDGSAAAVARDCAGWPADQAARWRAAHDLDDVRGAGWQPATRYTNARVYSRFLAAAAAAGHAPRLSRAGMRAFIAAHRELSLHTLAGYARAILRVTRILDPGHPDLAWLADRADRLQLRADERPKRKEAALGSVDAKAVLRLGLDEIASSLEAIGDTPDPHWTLVQRFSDGLWLVLGLLVPQRRHALASLRLTWIEAGLLRFPASVTKTGEPHDVPLPAMAAGLVAIWLRVRERRARGHGGLWIASSGRPATDATLYAAMRKLTRKRLGVALSPHRLRDLAATFVVETMPQHARIASAILAHKRWATTTAYVEQARQIAAVHALQRAQAAGAGAALRETRRKGGPSRAATAPAFRKRRKPGRASARVAEIE